MNFISRTFNFLICIFMLAALMAGREANSAQLFERQYELDGLGTYSLPFFESAWGTPGGILLIEARMYRNVSAVLINPTNDELSGLFQAVDSGGVLFETGAGRIGGGSGLSFYEETTFNPGENRIQGLIGGGSFFMFLPWAPHAGDPLVITFEMTEQFPPIALFADPISGDYWQASVRSVEYGNPHLLLAVRMPYEPSGVEVPSFANVPEPSTWIMMMLGFGCIGFVFRRMQRQSLRIVARRDDTHKFGV